MDYTKAVIVVTSDDVDDYFLAIELATGQEIGRRSSANYDTWRFDDGYDEEQMLRRVAIDFHINEYTVIHW